MPQQVLGVAELEAAAHDARCLRFGLIETHNNPNHGAALFVEAAVRAMARGSQQRTIREISHLMARSLCMPTPNISAA
jgi:hypothetical protein